MEPILNQKNLALSAAGQLAVNELLSIRDESFQSLLKCPDAEGLGIQCSDS